MANMLLHEIIVCPTSERNATSLKLFNLKNAFHDYFILKVILPAILEKKNKKM